MIGKLKHNSNFRGIVLMVACVFAFDTAAWSVPYVSAPKSESPQISVSVSQIIQNPASLAIPTEYVSLKEFHKGSNGKLLIHIQDAHSNYSGQMNLAKSLEVMMRQTGIQLVFVEGSDQEVTLRETKKAADKKTWEIAANRLLLQGIISGEEYLNLTSDLPMRLIGLEYQDLYDRNLVGYKNLVDRRDNLMKYLSRINTGIQSLKSRYYPEILRSYEELKLKNSDENFAASFDAMMNLRLDAGSEGLDGFPEIKKLQDLKLIENGINFNEASREQKNLVTRLKDIGLREQVEVILHSEKTSTPTHAAQVARLANLFALADAGGLQLDAYVHLAAYRQYLGLFEQLHLDTLLTEMDLMEDEIYRRILTDESARKVRAIDRYLQLLHKSFEIKLSSDEFRMLTVNQPEFDSVEWQAFMNDLLNESKDPESLIPFQADIDDAYPDLKNFYRTVNERDSAFLENTERILSDLDNNSGFLIAGGYHTANLTKLMRQQGYSYLVLTPVVDFETDHKQYEKNLLKGLALLNSDRQKQIASSTGQNKPSISTLRKLTYLKTPNGEKNIWNVPSYIVAAGMLADLENGKELKNERVPQSVSKIQLSSVRSERVRTLSRILTDDPRYQQSAARLPLRVTLAISFALAAAGLITTLSYQPNHNRTEVRIESPVDSPDELADIQDREPDSDAQKQAGVTENVEDADLQSQAPEAVPGLETIVQSQLFPSEERYRQIRGIEGLAEALPESRDEYVRNVREDSDFIPVLINAYELIEDDLPSKFGQIIRNGVKNILIINDSRYQGQAFGDGVIVVSKDHFRKRFLNAKSRKEALVNIIMFLIHEGHHNRLDKFEISQHEELSAYLLHLIVMFQYADTMSEVGLSDNYEVVNHIMDAGGNGIFGRYVTGDGLLLPAEMDYDLESREFGKRSMTRFDMLTDLNRELKEEFGKNSKIEFIDFFSSEGELKELFLEVFVDGQGFTYVIEETVPRNESWADSEEIEKGESYKVLDRIETEKSESLLSQINQVNADLPEDILELKKRDEEKLSRYLGEIRRVLADPKLNLSIENEVKLYRLLDRIKYVLSQGSRLSDGLDQTIKGENVETGGGNSDTDRILTKAGQLGVDYDALLRMIDSLLNPVEFDPTAAQVNMVDKKLRNQIIPERFHKNAEFLRQLETDVKQRQAWPNGSFVIYQQLIGVNRELKKALKDPHHYSDDAISDLNFKVKRVSGTSFSTILNQLPPDSGKKFKDAVAEYESLTPVLEKEIKFRERRRRLFFSLNSLLPGSTPFAYIRFISKLAFNEQFVRGLEELAAENIPDEPRILGRFRGGSEIKLKIERMQRAKKIFEGLISNSAVITSEQARVFTAALAVSSEKEASDENSLVRINKAVNKLLEDERHLFEVTNQIDNEYRKRIAEAGTSVLNSEAVDRILRAVAVPAMQPGDVITAPTGGYLQLIRADWQYHFISLDRSGAETGTVTISNNEFLNRVANHPLVRIQYFTEQTRSFRDSITADQISSRIVSLDSDGDLFIQVTQLGYGRIRLQLGDSINPEQITKFFDQEDRVTVGRSRDSSIRINKPWISRIGHLVIEFDDGEWKLGSYAKEINRKQIQVDGQALPEDENEFISLFPQGARLSESKFFWEQSAEELQSDLGKLLGSDSSSDEVKEFIRNAEETLRTLNSDIGVSDLKTVNNLFYELADKPLQSVSHDSRFLNRLQQVVDTSFSPSKGLSIHYKAFNEQIAEKLINQDKHKSIRALAGYYSAVFFKSSGELRDEQVISNLLEELDWVSIGSPDERLADRYKDIGAVFKSRLRQRLLPVIGSGTHLGTQLSIQIEKFVELKKAEGAEPESLSMQDYLDYLESSGVIEQMDQIYQQIRAGWYNARFMDHLHKEYFIKKMKQFLTDRIQKASGGQTLKRPESDYFQPLQMFFRRLGFDDDNPKIFEFLVRFRERYEDLDTGDKSFFKKHLASHISSLYDDYLTQSAIDIDKSELISDKLFEADPDSARWAVEDIVIETFHKNLSAHATFSDLLRTNLLQNPASAARLAVTFASEQSLGYQTQSVKEISSDEFTVEHNPYVARFLQYINPDHPLVSDENYQNDILLEASEGANRVSLVHQIPQEVLRQSDSYQVLKNSITESEAYKNGKILFTNENDLHFTVIGGLQKRSRSQDETLIELAEKLELSGEIRIRFQGLWVTDFVRGRAFIKAYPETGTDGRNKVGQLIEHLGGTDFKVYPSALFQLKDRLTDDEAKGLKSIFEEFETISLFEYPVTRLDLISFDNSLLENKRLIGSFDLSASGARLSAAFRKSREELDRLYEQTGRFETFFADPQGQIPASYENNNYREVISEDERESVKAAFRELAEYETDFKNQIDRIPTEKKNVKERFEAIRDLQRRYLPFDLKMGDSPEALESVNGLTPKMASSLFQLYFQSGLNAENMIAAKLLYEKVLTLPSIQEHLNPENLENYLRLLNLIGQHHPEFLSDEVAYETLLKKAQEAREAISERNYLKGPRQLALVGISIAEGTAHKNRYRAAYDFARDFEVYDGSKPAIDVARNFYRFRKSFSEDEIRAALKGVISEDGIDALLKIGHPGSESASLFRPDPDFQQASALEGLISNAVLEKNLSASPDDSSARLIIDPANRLQSFADSIRRLANREAEKSKKSYLEAYHPDDSEVPIGGQYALSNVSRSLVYTGNIEKAKEIAPVVIRLSQEGNIASDFWTSASIVEAEILSGKGEFEERAKIALEQAIKLGRKNITELESYYDLLKHLAERFQEEIEGFQPLSRSLPEVEKFRNEIIKSHKFLKETVLDRLEKAIKNLSLEIEVLYEDEGASSPARQLSETSYRLYSGSKALRPMNLNFGGTVFGANIGLSDYGLLNDFLTEEFAGVSTSKGVVKRLIDIENFDEFNEVINQFIQRQFDLSDFELISSDAHLKYDDVTVKGVAFLGADISKKGATSVLAQTFAGIGDCRYCNFFGQSALMAFVNMKRQKADGEFVRKVLGQKMDGYRPKAYQQALSEWQNNDYHYLDVGIVDSNLVAPVVKDGSYSVSKFDVNGNPVRKNLNEAEQAFLDSGGDPDQKVKIFYELDDQTNDLEPHTFVHVIQFNKEAAIEASINGKSPYGRQDKIDDSYLNDFFYQKVYPLRGQKFDPESVVINPNGDLTLRIENALPLIDRSGPTPVITGDSAPLDIVIKKRSRQDASQSRKVTTYHYAGFQGLYGHTPINYPASITQLLLSRVGDQFSPEREGYQKQLIGMQIAFRYLLAGEPELVQLQPLNELQRERLTDAKAEITAPAKINTSAARLSEDDPAALNDITEIDADISVVVESVVPQSAVDRESVVEHYSKVAQKIRKINADMEISRQQLQALGMGVSIDDVDKRNLRNVEAKLGVQNPGIIQLIQSLINLKKASADNPVRVLDLGAGNGELIRDLYKQLKSGEKEKVRLTGLDPWYSSEVGLAGIESDSVNWVQSYFEYASDAGLEGQFDLILGTEVLQYAYNQNEFLNLILSSLSPDGMAFIGNSTELNSDLIPQSDQFSIINAEGRLQISASRLSEASKVGQYFDGFSDDGIRLTPAGPVVMDELWRAMQANPELQAKFLTDLPSPKVDGTPTKILSVGAGIGDLERWILESRPDIQIEAIDISQKNVDSANEKLSDLKIQGRFSAVVHDAYKLSERYSSGEFDSTLFIHSIGFIDLNSALDQVARVNSRDARLIITEITEEAYSADYRQYVNDVSPVDSGAEYQFALELNGFQNTSIERVGVDYNYIFRDFKQQLRQGRVTEDIYWITADLSSPKSAAEPAVVTDTFSETAPAFSGSRLASGASSDASESSDDVVDLLSKRLDINPFISRAENLTETDLGLLSPELARNMAKSGARLALLSPSGAFIASSERLPGQKYEVTGEGLNGSVRSIIADGSEGIGFEIDDFTPAKSVISSAVRFGFNLVQTAFSGKRDVKVSRVTRDVLARAKGPQNQPLQIGNLVLIADGLLSGVENGILSDSDIRRITTDEQSRSEFIENLLAWRDGIAFTRSYNGNFIVQLQSVSRLAGETQKEFELRQQLRNRLLQPVADLIQEQGFDIEIADTTKPTTYIIPHNSAVGTSFGTDAESQKRIGITTYQPTELSDQTGQVIISETTKALVFAGSSNLLTASKLLGQRSPYKRGSILAMADLFTGSRDNSESTEEALEATQNHEYTERARSILKNFLFAVKAGWEAISAARMARENTQWAA